MNIQLRGESRRLGRRRAGGYPPDVDSWTHVLLGVLVAGVVLLTSGWPYVDPIVGVGIGLFILPRAYRLGREALTVLLQLAPADVDITSLRDRLAALPGVAGVHDLHVWTLTSGLRVGTGHVALAAGAAAEDVLTRARALLHEEVGLEHVTIQIEPPGFDNTAETPV